MSVLLLLIFTYFRLITYLFLDGIIHTQGKSNFGVSECISKDCYLPVKLGKPDEVVFLSFIYSSYSGVILLCVYVLLILASFMLYPLPTAMVSSCPLTSILRYLTPGTTKDHFITSKINLKECRTTR